MLEQFRAAAAAARTFAAVNDISAKLWKAHGAGALSDDAAQAAAEAVEARRAALKASLQPRPAAAPPAPRRAPRSPDKQASLERRRRQAASGAMPPQIAAQFTMGEAAALAVVARQIQQGGTCRLPVDAVAALAGVSRTTVQNAIRQAKTLGLVRVHERRRRGAPNLTNIITVIDRAWLSWLKLSGQGVGFRKLNTTVKRNLKNTENDVRPVKNGDGGQSGMSSIGLSRNSLAYSSSGKAGEGSSRCTITKQVLSA